MKTEVIAAVMAFMAFGLVSCDDSRTLRSDVAEEVRMYSGEFSVDHWTKVSERDGTNQYYKHDIKCHEIDYDVLRGGQINCYLYTGTDSQVPLPCVRHYENGNGDRWTRTIDCEYWHGGLTIFVTDSDFAGSVPEPMSFRVMVSW